MWVTIVFAIQYRREVTLKIIKDRFATVVNYTD